MKLLSLLIFISIISGCVSTQTKPNNDHVIPYNDEKSLAWNVINQIEASDKVVEVDAPEKNVVSDTSAMEHVAFAALSWDFLGGLGTSLLLDNKYPLDRSNLIMAVDLRNAKNGDIGMEVAKIIKKAAIQRNPNATFSNIEPYIDGYKFTEQGEDCNKLLDFYVKRNPNRSTYKLYKEKGICDVFMRGLEIIGPANEKLFPNAKNLITVRLTFDLHRFAGNFMKYLPNAYLYHSPSESSSRTGVKAYPAFIEHKNNAYFFVKKAAVESEEFSLPVNATLNYGLTQEVR